MHASQEAHKNAMQELSPLQIVSHPECGRHSSLVKNELPPYVVKEFDVMLAVIQHCRSNVSKADLR